MTAVYIEIAAIILLILLNGFFSMSEMAVVSSRIVRLKTRADAGDRMARAALRLAGNTDKFLSTVQIGITLVGVLTGVFGGATLAEKLESFFRAIPLLAPYKGVLSLGLVVIPITFLTLVFGELVPKRLAIGNPEKLAGISAPVMLTLMRIVHPVVRLLSFSTKTVIRLLGYKPSNEPSVTEEEIRGIIREGAMAGVLEHTEKDMLDRIIRLGDRQVRAMMTHRSKVVWLDQDDTAEEHIRIIKESPFSRFPVSRGDIGNIVGILKVKQFLLARLENRNAGIGGYLVQPLYVPETTRIQRLLEIFRSRSETHFAVIVDEYGDVQGIITLNDILEAIVGDIPSAGEEPEPGYTRREDGSLVMDALLPMDEVLSVLNLRPEEDKPSYQTLAGFVISHLGEIPVTGRYVEKYGFRFEVIDMDGKRVDAVLVTPLGG